MRTEVDLPKLQAFFQEIGRLAGGPGRVYLTGGSTVLLLGIRPQTIDIDIKLDPEPKGIFEAIAALKEGLLVNVELASPDLFLPPVPGWQERSVFITRAGHVEFFHYDLYSQVLSKVLRGHEKDIQDAQALIAVGKLDPKQILELFREIEPNLVRFPSIDREDFELRLTLFVQDIGNE